MPYDEIDSLTGKLGDARQKMIETRQNLRESRRQLDSATSGMEELLEGLDEAEEAVSGIDTDDEEESVSGSRFDVETGRTKRRERVEKRKDKKRKAKSSHSKSKEAATTVQRSVKAAKAIQSKAEDNASELEQRFDVLEKEVKQLVAAKERKVEKLVSESEQFMTLISSNVTMINSGAAAGSLTVNVTLAKDCFVDSFGFRALLAPGAAAATTAGVRITQVQLNQSENLLTSFNANNANTTNVTGLTAAANAVNGGKCVGTADIGSVMVPVKRLLKANQPISVSLANLSAAPADGCIVDISARTQNGATITVMSI